MYKFFIILFITPKIFFAQNNMSEANMFITELEKNTSVNRFLKISINKNKEYLKFKEIKYILFYKDSLKILSFKETKNEKFTKYIHTIVDKEIISKSNIFFENHSKYRSKCQYRGFYKDNDFLPHFPNEKIKFSGYSKNEWYITSGQLNDENYYIYKFSNKVKLTRIDCLGFSKNLKSRKLYKQFLKNLN